MLKKHLKIFDLDENFSLEELQEKYDSHLKEFDISDIDDELKNIYLEEQIRIRESHKVLLEYYYKNKNDNSSSSKSKINFIDVRQKKNSFISTFFLKVNIFLIVIISGFIIWDQFKANKKPVKTELPVEQKCEETNETETETELEEAEEKANKELQKKEKKEGKKVKCAAVNKSGNRCGIEVLPSETYCTIHEKVEQNETGEKKQCTKIKSNGKRCKMQTNSKSGLCYYHD